MDWIVEQVFCRVLGGLLEAIFYWPGWLLLQILTLGSYPPSQTIKHNRFAVALFAVVFLALCAGVRSII